MFKWNQPITAFLVLVWFLGAWLMAQQHYQSRARSIIQEKTVEGQRVAADISDRIKKNIRYFHGIPAMLAEEPIIKQALNSGNSTSAAAIFPVGVTESARIDGALQGELDDFLAGVKKNLGADAAWVMNIAGDCLAASNDHETNSFVGSNFSDRDYFRLARRYQAAQQYAFGRRSHLPGLYFASSVLSEGQFIGTVAVKMNMDNLTNWVDATGAFLTDGFGVIVLANNPEILMQAVPHGQIERLSVVKRQERYHRETFPVLSMAPWVSTNLGPLILFNHEAPPQLLFAQTVPLEGLRVYVPQRVPELLTLNRDRWWYFILLAISGASLILLVSASLQYVRYHHRANQTLVSQKNLLMDAERIAQLGSWSCNLATGSVELSAQAGEIFKFGPSRLRPTYAFFMEGVVAEDRDRVKKAIELAVNQGVPCDLEYGFAPAGGGRRIVHLQARLVHDHSARQIRMVGTVQDITARKHTEAELFQSRETLRMVLNNIPQRVFWKNRDMIFQGCNVPMAIDCGFKDPTELIGKSDFEITSAANAERYRAIDIEVMESNQPKLNFELTETRPDGSLAYFLVKKVPLHDKEGRVVGILGAYEDITERKFLESQLRQAQKMEAIGRLAGGVAHDFNNLLTVICGYSEILLSEAAPGDPSRDSLVEIKKAGDRAAGLTRQLLAFSRKQVLEPDILDLNEIVGDCENMFSRLLGENIELKVIQAPNLGKIKADSSQIDQVLLNLVVNARDAMPRGGKLIIETANAMLDETYCHLHEEVKPGRYVSLTVSDTGCGMDEQTLTHIFEPFFTTKDLGKGTGLGLAMIFGFIKQSGGHVSVESEPEQGSIFKIFLPEFADIQPE